MRTWLAKLLGRIGRRFWVHRIDRVLGTAYEMGKIDSWLLHELDAKMKYGTPMREWTPRDAERRGGKL